MPWNNRGTVTPTETAWLPFTATTGSGGTFRVTYAAPRAIDRIDTFGWLAWRYIGGVELLPPVPAKRIYPDARGKTFEILFNPELLALGYTQRIFEIKRNRRDIFDWSVQIEELI